MTGRIPDRAACLGHRFVAADADVVEHPGVHLRKVQTLTTQRGQLENGLQDGPAARAGEAGGPMKGGVGLDMLGHDGFLYNL